MYEIILFFKIRHIEEYKQGGAWSLPRGTWLWKDIKCHYWQGDKEIKHQQHSHRKEFTCPARDLSCSDGEELALSNITPLLITLWR